MLVEIVILKSARCILHILHVLGLRAGEVIIIFFRGDIGCFQDIQNTQCVELLTGTAVEMDAIIPPCLTVHIS